MIYLSWGPFAAWYKHQADLLNAPQLDEDGCDADGLDVYGNQCPKLQADSLNAPQLDEDGCDADGLDVYGNQCPA